MHACHVIHSLGAGGAEQLLVDLASVASDEGLRVSVVELVSTAEAVHARTLLANGVEVRRLRLSSRWDPRAFSRALQAVDALDPNVVHTHMKHADLVGATVARRRHLPLVSTLHVIEDEVSLLGMGKRWLAGQARRRLATRTIAVSEAQRRWYLEAFPGDPSRVVTLYNGIIPAAPLEGAARAEIRASLGVPAQAVLALNVALMRSGKGHDDLLAAVAQLPESSPLVLVLVGDGPERSRLETVVSGDPRIASRVRFAGYRHDVAEVLQAADLVVHPSHAEALPTALIHALSAGVPMIATAVGGVPEVVGRTAGLLVPAREPRRLAEALSRMVNDPSRRVQMGAAGRQRFEEMFHARLWARRLVSLYEEVLHERIAA